MSTDRQSFLDDLQQRVSELLRGGPAGDIERHLKAVLAQAFQRMELVTREEFEVQRELLERLRARVDALEHALRQQEADADERG